MKWIRKGIENKKKFDVIKVEYGMVVVVVMVLVVETIL